MTALLTIVSHVGRGGLGKGARAWRITGPSNVNPPYASKVCIKEVHASHIDIFLPEPGVYELRAVGGFNGAKGEAFSGFIKVAADGSYSILGGRTMESEAVLAEVEKS